MSLRSFGLALFVSSVCSGALAQVGWRQVVLESTPTGRYGHAMAGDTARGRTVLFGGADSSGSVLQDTWEWDGASWTNVFTPSSPPPRQQFAMVYDSARGRTVMFGGNNLFVDLGDTWEWDGSVWVQANPATSPSPRRGHAMAFDSIRNRVVLFGGFDGSTYVNDTWEWDGSNWTQISPANSPSPRTQATMTFDAANGVSVLVGGVAGCSRSSCNQFDETWTWNGADWTQAAPAHSPGPRAVHALVFDPTIGAVVFFGGYFNLSGPVIIPLLQNDTWLWTGADWIQANPSTFPSPRRDFGAAFDPATGHTMLFGGSDDSNLYLNDQWLAGLPPVLTALNPTRGGEGGGDWVQIDGSGFTDDTDMRAYFADGLATIVEVAPDHVSVRTPPGSGTADVRLVSGFGEATLAGAFTYVPAYLAARFGTVNRRGGPAENVLVVNGSFGDDDRNLSVAVNSPLTIFMSVPSSRTDSHYVLYAWRGIPGPSNVTTMPRHLGYMVFPTPFAGTTPQPRAIWNNLGHTALLGSPTFPSTPAPSVVMSRPGGLHAPIDVTLQGIIEDDASIVPEHVSITNAVLLHVTP
jgi:IPT/TIG domain-containing protein/galactose oxidase-like protein